MSSDGVMGVAQLRGRRRFYHVGDPTRKDIDTVCDSHDGQARELIELRAIIDGVGAGSLAVGDGVTASSVLAWLDGNEIKLLPWQRKRMTDLTTRTKPV